MAVEKKELPVAKKKRKPQLRIKKGEAPNDTIIKNGRGPGRPPGLQNKIGLNLKTSLAESFELLGGTKWLLSLARSEDPIDRKGYIQLLSKIIPQGIEVGGQNGEKIDISVSFIRSENEDKP